ncbi:unnamed protein product [Bemisia tabaci]|uniref:Uncharacterized protein n=1 Tax=Bemisia tabaci TaxID=7038 RepID=A0A9P0APF3_BEMTA|nr:unnamed protein product [Bemisia tabaci]
MSRYHVDAMTRFSGEKSILFLVTIFLAVHDGFSTSDNFSIRGSSSVNQSKREDDKGVRIIASETHESDNLTDNNHQSDHNRSIDTQIIEELKGNTRDFLADDKIISKKDGALFLTPLIEAGQIEKAQHLSEVSLVRDIKSFAGYLTVNSTSGANLFFWLFKSQQGKFEERPLIVWLHGGLAQTAMFGLFRDTGPFYVGRDKKLKRRKYAWTQKYNMVFVDNPVGAGFSFTKSESGYPTSLKAVTEDLYKFLVQLHRMFPSFKQNKLVLVGESTGTVYAELLAQKIFEENKISDCKLNLRRLIIASRHTDQGMLRRSSSFLFELGLIDDFQRQEIAGYEEELRAIELIGNATESGIHWAQTVKRIKEFTGLRDTLDFVHDDIGVYQKKASSWFLNQPEIKKALHVGEHEFTENSAEAGEHLLRTPWASTKSAVESMLTDGSLPILSVYGQLDPFRSIRGRMFDDYEWPRSKEYFKAKRCQFMVGDEVAGYYKTTGPLTEVLLRNSGHLIAAAKPRWALELIDRFIGDEKSFQCS